MFLYVLAVIIAIISIGFEKIGKIFNLISNELAIIANRIGLYLLGY